MVSKPPVVDSSYNDLFKRSIDDACNIGSEEFLESAVNVPDSRVRNVLTANLIPYSVYTAIQTGVNDVNDSLSVEFDKNLLKYTKVNHLNILGNYPC